jgi:hypothetical protein
MVQLHTAKMWLVVAITSTGMTPIMWSRSVVILLIGPHLEAASLPKQHKAACNTHMKAVLCQIQQQKLGSLFFAKFSTGTKATIPQSGQPCRPATWNPSAGSDLDHGHCACPPGTARGLLEAAQRRNW